MNLTFTAFFLPKIACQTAENSTIRNPRETQKGPIWSRKMVLFSYNWALNSLKPLDIKLITAKDSYQHIFSKSKIFLSKNLLIRLLRHASIAPDSYRVVHFTSM